MLTRARVHQLIEEMPESELPEVARFLAERRSSTDPFLRALANAPEDDEPRTAEDEAAIQEGLDAIERGEVVMHAALRLSEAVPGSYRRARAIAPARPNDLAPETVIRRLRDA